MKPNRPKLDVAVVITCHNYGRFLQECLDSVLQQTVPAAEVVVVLDDCTDDSAEIARSYPARLVQVLEIQACEVYLARRAGLAATKSPVLCFLDADDVLTATYIEEALPYLADPTIGVVTGEAHEFGLSEWVWRPTVVQNMETENCCVAPSLVRRSALQQAAAFEQFEPLSQVTEDWFVWRRVLDQGWRVGFSPARYHYRRHDNNATLSSDHWWVRRWLTRAGKPQRQNLRVAWLADRLDESLARTLWAFGRHHKHIEWLGLGLLEEAPVAEAWAQTVSAFMPVFVPTEEFGHSEWWKVLGSIEQVVERLTGQAEVLVVSGISAVELLDQNECPLPRVLALSEMENSAVWNPEVLKSFSRVVGQVPNGFTQVPPALQDRFVEILPGPNLQALQASLTRQELRNEWNLSSDQLVIGCPGNWEELKRGFPLAEAVQALGEEAYAAYHIDEGIGSVPIEDRETIEKLVDGRVRWVDDTPRGDCYAAWDCVLWSDDHQSLAPVVLDALACGCPVVAPRMALWEELHRQFGHLVTLVSWPASGEELAEAVRAAVSSENCDQISHARDVVLNFLNGHRSARQWERVLLAVAAESTDAPSAMTNSQPSNSSFSSSTCCWPHPSSLTGGPPMHHTQSRPPKKVDPNDDFATINLLDHARSTRWKGSLPEPCWRIRFTNPGCGDELRIDARVQGGRIVDMRFEGHGCFVSQACASLVCEAAVGLDIAQAQRLKAIDALGFDVKVLTGKRQVCAQLALAGLKRLLELKAQEVLSSNQK